MRSIKLNLSKQSVTGWDAAVTLVDGYFSGNLKANQLLDGLPQDFSGERRAICQSLFLGALRHGHRVQAGLQPLLRKNPRSLVQAILLVAGYEMLAADTEKMPKIVHHAVERGKKMVAKSELGFLNAVLRRLPDSLATLSPDSEIADFYSHPRWLVKRWQSEFGLENTTRLLKWNQNIPATYLKLYRTLEDIPAGLEATQWPQFYKASAEASWSDDLRPLLNNGDAYAKDPSTRIAPELLAPQAGESVLDLCAAPGGKAFDLAHAMQQHGTIIAVDLPGKRIARLRENLSTLNSDKLFCKIVEKDVLQLTPTDFVKQKLPETYDAVMLDAPCSNTGVIQRRTDVKWRLETTDIEDCAALQAELLQAAAQFVKPSGRLVYSTCSIEDAENTEVVEAFLNTEIGQAFALTKSHQSLPWESGHDGAGAFLLIRECSHSQ
ncbi:MAG TPA: RNA methyltransferase [Opitutae bacterium]|nr:RNA methyltransferase [Opitutae bacterium]